MAELERAVSARRLTKRFGDFVAVDAIDFEGKMVRRDIGWRARTR